MDKVYYLGYRGGSGGYLLLHLLLLSGKFHVSFEEDKTIEEIVADQWKIVDPNKWKSLEHKPNNAKTISSASNLDKILFFCNPRREYFFGDRESFLDVGGYYGTAYPTIKTVYIYTDIDSQHELAFYKKAYCYKPRQGHVMPRA